MDKKRQTGFSLIELLVAVAILVIISSIAMPLYRDYIDTARVGSLMQSMSSIEPFQEDIFLRTGAYQPGVYNGGSDANLLVLGWSPKADDGTVYNITVAGATYTVDATATDGTNVCRIYPARVVCP